MRYEVGEETREAHASVTLDRVVDASMRQVTTLDNPGICLHCGEDVEGCEPDARNYECEGCGERAVFGSSELVMMMVI